MEPSEKETHFVTKGLNSVLASLHSWCWGYVHEQMDVIREWPAMDTGTNELKPPLTVRAGTVLGSG